jgi:hypothetical protein
MSTNTNSNDRFFFSNEGKSKPMSGSSRYGSSNKSQARARQNSGANMESSQLQSGREVNHRPLLLVTSTAALINSQGDQDLGDSHLKQASKRSGASMASNDNLMSVSSNDKTAVVEQNSSKPHSANLRISIPVR